MGTSGSIGLVGDLDMEEINKTIDAAKFDLKLNTKNLSNGFLSHYGLIKRNFTNAAVLLFAKTQHGLFPGRVRVALLKGGKTSDEFTDDRLLMEYFQIDGSTDFFDKHLQLKRKFDNKDWERMIMKFHESFNARIMNALVHRNILFLQVQCLL